MSTQEQLVSETQNVANRLVELCSQGKFNEAQDELFHENATSAEPAHTTLPVAEGLAAIRERGKQFQDGIAENNGGYVNAPIVAGNHFAVAMGMDVTMKDGNRMKMDEVAVYKVADGRIVSEQFFY